MPKQITKTVYQIDELSAKAKEKVRDNYIRTIPDWWHDYVIEDCEVMLTEAGFPNSEINYSGFGSQGDGASFTSDVDVYKLYPVYCAETGARKLSDKQLEFLLNYVSFEVKRDTHRYSHENTCSLHCSGWNYGGSDRQRMDKALSAFTEWLEKRRLSLCGEIYQSLEKEFDYITSEEYIWEQMRGDETWFFETGEIYDGQ